MVDSDEGSGFDSLRRGSEDTEFAEPSQPRSSAKTGDRKKRRVSPDNPLDEPLRKKSKHRVSSPRRENTSSAHQHSGYAFARDDKSKRGVQQPTPQSARLSVNAEISDSESDVVVLDDVHCRPDIKEERVRIKEEPFSVEVCYLSHMVYPCINFDYSMSLTRTAVLFQPS